MRLVLNSFLIFLFFVFSPAFAKEHYKKYNIKVSGIKIGTLEWLVYLSENEYYNRLKLESEGMLSFIYSFDGEYFSSGFRKNMELESIEYSHLWKTKGVTKEMNLGFFEKKLASLVQTPNEKEHIRINIFDIKNTKDPLTSFLQIIIGGKGSQVVDGRRLYNMSVLKNDNNNRKIIGIINYFNLWADHKKNKFEKIIFEDLGENILPSKIDIYFDNKTFKLE